MERAQTPEKARSMEKAKALSKAASLCAMSEQCENDIAQKLIKWGVDENSAAEILARLTKEGYLSDERYARAFAHDHIRYHHWGRQKISYALRQKRVSRDAIDAALASIDDEWADEYAAALRHTLGSLPRDYQMRQKAMRRAASHGFLAEEVFLTLNSDFDFDFEL